MRVEFEDRMGDLLVKVTADVDSNSVTITKLVDVEACRRLPWKDAEKLSPQDVQRIEKHAREAAGGVVNKGINGVAPEGTPDDDGGSPKLSLTMTLPPDSLEVWVDALVYRAYAEPGKEADSFKTFRRLVGLRGPDAEARVSTCCNRLVTAIKKKGPGMTYEDLVRLAEAWERGELDVH